VLLDFLAGAFLQVGDERFVLASEGRPIMLLLVEGLDVEQLANLLPIALRGSEHARAGHGRVHQGIDERGPGTCGENENFALADDPRGGVGQHGPHEIGHRKPTQVRRRLDDALLVLGDSGVQALRALRPGCCLHLLKPLLNNARQAATHVKTGAELACFNKP